MKTSSPFSRAAGIDAIFIAADYAVQQAVRPVLMRRRPHSFTAPCGVNHIERHPMEIEPPNLNVPLQRKERWGLLLVAVCCGVMGLAAFFSPSFAIVFAASSIVGLPVLLLFALPSSASERFRAWGDLGRLAGFATFFGYIALSKKVLVPFVISVIEHALS